MRIVYMGSPDFAAVPLKRLIEAGYDIICVVTRPDMPKNRGGHMAATPVKEAAQQAGITVFQPPKINLPESVAYLQSLVADIFVVVAYGQLLKPEVLALPPLGAVNIHASLLPAYRGAAPINRAIINGETVTGVTSMYLDEGMDTGDMIFSSSCPVNEDDDFGLIHDRLRDLGGELLIKTLDAIADGTALRKPQDPCLASYAPLLTKEDELLDWHQDARSLHNRVRGLSPFPGAYSYFNGKRLKILRSSYNPEPVDADCGQIISIDSQSINIATASGVLMIKELQPEGKKRMDVSSFACGYGIKKGMFLGF